MRAEILTVLRRKDESGRRRRGRKLAPAGAASAAVLAQKRAAAIDVGRAFRGVHGAEAIGEMLEAPEMPDFVHQHAGGVPSVLAQLGQRGASDGPFRHGLTENVFQSGNIESGVGKQRQHTLGRLAPGIRHGRGGPAAERASTRSIAQASNVSLSACAPCSASAPENAWCDEQLHFSSAGVVPAAPGLA